MASASPSAGVFKLGGLIAKMQTPQGRALVQAYLPKLRPAVSPSGQDYLPPFEDNAPLPKDKFERAIVEKLYWMVVPQGKVGSHLSAAMSDALRDVAKGDAISSATLVKRMGPQALQFAKALERIELTDERDPMSDRLMLEGLAGDERQALIGLLGMDAPELPALDYFLHHLAEPGELDGLKLHAVQHLFASTATLFEALALLGIDFGDMHVKGKLYSTNEHVAEYIKRKGIKLSQDGLAPGAYRPSDQMIRESTHVWLTEIISTLPHPPEKNPKPRAVILDDGGEAIATLHREYPEYEQYFIGIEQTRRGAKKLRKLNLNMAVANVAEAWAKLMYESPLIGHSVALEVGRKLDELTGYGVETRKEAVVIGYGAVGTAVARALADRGILVHVYDESPLAVAQAEADGFLGHVDQTDAMPHADILVSCTGERTLSSADHVLLPDGAILFNAASADDELGAPILRDFMKHSLVLDDEGYVWGRFRGKPICQGLGRAEAHSDTIVQHPSGKEFLLVHNGYVANMTGERDPIPPRYIQLTRALLLLGVLAALRSNKKNLIDIPMDWQRALVAFIQRQLRKTREDLRKPSWERIDGYPKTPIRKPPPEAAQLNDENGWLELYPAITQEASEPDGEPKTYGYRLGPAKKGTLEAWIDEVHGNKDGTLTPAEAGLHRALLTVNREFKLDISASMSIDSPVLVGSNRQTGAPEYKTHLPCDDEKTHFERCYAHYLLAFTRAALERKYGKSVGDELIAGYLGRMFVTSSVKREAVLAALDEQRPGMAYLIDEILEPKHA